MTEPLHTRHTGTPTGTHEPTPGARSMDPATAESRKKLPWIIAVLMLSMLISSLGQMIFSTALPTIVGELGGVNHMSWVITAFLLGQTISLPIFGKLGDLIGRKGLFIFANSLFILGSLLGGAAPSMGVLIVARAIQGIAGGGMMTLTQAITAEVTTARERPKYMGIMGSVFGVSSVLGPLLGGWFTDGPGWRWGLWMNIPLGLITITAVSFLLRLPKPTGKFTFDFLGTLTMAVSTASLVLFVTWGGNEYEWSSPVIIGLIIAAVVFGTLFVIVERRHSEPLIPLSFFRTRNFVLTTIAGFGIGVFMFGSLAYLPTYMQMVHGMSPTQAGLMTIPMMVGLMGTSIVVGQVVTHTGNYKRYPIVGLIIVTAGLLLLSTMRQQTSLVTVGLYFFVFGLGIGCAMQVLVIIAQNSFSVSQVGTATATNNFFRQIGGSVGSAFVGGLFSAGLASQLSEKLPDAIAAAASSDPTAAQQLSQLDASSLTPALVEQLPEMVRQAIEFSYNNALTPIFLFLSPLAFVCAMVLFGVKENKLQETIS